MSKYRILIIEDQTDVRENIAELLELSSYQVETAQNGKEGVKQALSNPPDLVLCDIRMPEMDGYEVLYLLSKNTKTASIPFIYLTAKAETTDFRKGMNLGADDYITKPFEEIELLGAIERRIQKFRDLSKADSIDMLVKSASKYHTLKDLDQERKHRSFKKKDIIYREGDYGGYVYKIKSGKVKTYRINQGGKEFIHDILTEGDYLGERALIQDTSSTEFAEAMEDTELILIPRNEFNELIFGNREVSGHFIKMLSKNLSEREHELMGLAYNTVRKRTADALMKLYESYKNTEGITKFDISRADLASMVGTAPESVIRTLSEFKKDKWIKVEGSTIIINEPDKIELVRF